jgi:hypothetical protein
MTHKLPRQCFRCGYQHPASQTCSHAGYIRDARWIFDLLLICAGTAALVGFALSVRYLSEHHWRLPL